LIGCVKKRKQKFERPRNVRRNRPTKYAKLGSETFSKVAVEFEIVGRG